MLLSEVRLCSGIILYTIRSCNVIKKGRILFGLRILQGVLVALDFVQTLFSIFTKSVNLVRLGKVTYRMYHVSKPSY